MRRNALGKVVLLLIILSGLLFTISTVAPVATYSGESYSQEVSTTQVTLFFVLTVSILIAFQKAFRVEFSHRTTKENYFRAILDTHYISIPPPVKF